VQEKGGSNIAPKGTGEKVRNVAQKEIGGKKGGERGYRFPKSFKRDEVLLLFDSAIDADRNSRDLQNEAIEGVFREKTGT